MLINPKEKGDPVKIPPESIYIFYTAALGIMTFAVVPRMEIRRLSILAIIYGAITDFFIIIFLTHLLGIGGHTNYHPFGFMGIPFFPLLAWVFYFIIYLYFLPKKGPWSIIYTVAASGYDTLFSNVLQNLNIFQWKISSLYLPFILYLTWNLLVTFTYQKYFRDKDFY